MNIKGYIITVAGAGMFIFSSCTNAVDEEVGMNIPQTLQVIAPYGMDTRVVYEEEGKNINVKWKPGDQITLADLEHWDAIKYRYNGQENTSTATFDLYKSESRDELTGDFIAVHGTDLSYTRSIDVEVDYGYFGQSGDNTFEHLAPRNAMLAKGICENGEIQQTLEFHSLLSILSFEITMPEGTTPQYIKLCSNNGKLRVSERYDLSGESIGVGHTSEIRMNLVNIDSNHFTANMLLVPCNLKEEDLQISITDKDNKTYLSDLFKGSDFKAGKHYTKTIIVEGN